MKRIRVIHHEGHEVHEAGNILQSEAPPWSPCSPWLNQLFVFEDFVTRSTWRVWSTWQEDREGRKSGDLRGKKVE